MLIFLKKPRFTMPEPTPTHEKTTAQEIAELERLLEEKKRVLAAAGREREEKDVFKETFRETYGAAFSPPSAAKRALPPQPVSQSTPLPTLSADELDKHAEELKTKAREEQLNDMVTLALTRGVKAAAEVARHATPWLMDELHDRLQDKYYEQLIEFKKLKPL